MSAPRGVLANETMTVLVDMVSLPKIQSDKTRYRVTIAIDERVMPKNDARIGPEILFPSRRSK